MLVGYIICSRRCIVIVLDINIREVRRAKGTRVAETVKKSSFIILNTQ